MRLKFQRFTSSRPPIRRMAVGAAIAVFALASTACATASSGNPFEGGSGGGAPGQHIRVFVQNLGLVAIHIYAITPRGNRNLGTVQTGQNSVFDVPWTDTGPLSFRLEDATDPAYTTQSVNVSTGDQVEVDIPADGSYVSVRVR